MTTRRAALLSAIALVAVSGCGSSKSPSSTSGTSPSSYRAQVNALCASDNAQITAMPKSEGTTLAGLDKLDAIAVGTINKVKAIPIPSSISSGVSSWLGVIEQEKTNAGQIIADLKAGKTSAAQALATRAGALGAHGNSDAKALGLSSCAVNAQPSGS